MHAMLPAILAMALALSGCFAPRAEVVARNWRPLGGSSLPLGRLIALSPGIRTATWESFAGVDGRTVVRLAAEYDPTRASAGCPPLEAGLALAARSFLIVDLAVTPDGKVDFIASKAQAYNADGYFEEYGLDIGVIAALVARASPIPCADFGLPAYLR